VLKRGTPTRKRKFDLCNLARPSLQQLSSCCAFTESSPTSINSVTDYHTVIVSHELIGRDVCDLQKMFDLLTSLGATQSLNVVNRRGLTPFTLAATLARTKVSFHFSLTCGRAVGYIERSISARTSRVSFIATATSDNIVASVVLVTRFIVKNLRIF